LRGQEAEIWTLREALSSKKTAVYTFYITPQGAHAWMGGWMGGWMDGWIDGWMDAWMITH